ncbi:MAG: hypothetical protein FWE57_02765 [Chitinispirillia bacterium]|nr:hypothetical protein [Chitinispirillia bacterium]
MKKVLLFALTLSVGAWAAESLDERVDALSAQFDRAVNKAGIHFSGEFRSQYLSSTVSQSAVEKTATSKSNESVQYTSVDFDIAARPNNAFSGRAVFRLHQDWRNFFGDVHNPITTRWLSMDGSLMGGIISYSLGDYKKRVSPLTLWSPDMEFLYEPEIFAMNRRFAMAESFIGGNNRLLQGMDLSFKARLYPLLEEVEANVFGARLASPGTRESSVLPPPQRPGSPVSQFDKYLIGATLGTQIYKGLGLGITNIAIFDHKESFSGLEKAADTASQSTNVFSGRFNADNRFFMESDFVKFGVDFEAALSKDRKAWLDGPIADTEVKDSTVDGMAVNAGLFVRLAFGDDVGSVKLRGTFINNDSTFRNDAAQTPVFFQHAIMNNENGLNGLGAKNPFDAIYRTVFKYVPSQYSHTGIQPQTKTAYNVAILSESAYEDADLSVFQSALPGGLATADRSGPVINLDGLFLNNAVSVGVKAAMLKTMREFGVAFNDVGDVTKREKADFMEVAGGASVDIAKFAPAVGPSLIVGGSYGMYNTELGKSKEENTLLAGELNYRFHNRFSLLFGYQQLVMNTKGFDGKVDGPEYTFTNFAAGVQYRVADGGAIIAKFNRVGGERAEFNDQPKLTYKAVQPELFLTVTF